MHRVCSLSARIDNQAEKEKNEPRHTDNENVREEIRKRDGNGEERGVENDDESGRGETALLMEPLNESHRRKGLCTLLRDCCRVGDVSDISKSVLTASAKI